VGQELVTAIAEIREDEALDLVKDALDAQKPPADILDECQQGVKIVGDRFESGEYYLPELIMAGEILKKVSVFLKPGLAESNGGTRTSRGKIVLGTVRGDLHDIGKDIVALVLEGNGYDVTDLGVDVPEERFVEAVAKVRPQVVALSGLLTLAFDSMKSTVEALDAAGLRKDVKIMIGGAVVDETVRESCGADGYGRNVGTALKLANQWIPPVG
jgi:methanogenic corrinoid protein MtbC1